MSDDVLTIEVLRSALDYDSPPPLSMADLEAISHDPYIPLDEAEAIELPKELEGFVVEDDTTPPPGG